MENRQQTPLALAIEINRKSIKMLQEIKTKTDFEKGMLAYAHAFEENLKDLKPKEREMLESAYKKISFLTSAEYFDTNLTQE